MTVVAVKHRRTLAQIGGEASCLIRLRPTGREISEELHECVPVLPRGGASRLERRRRFDELAVAREGRPKHEMRDALRMLARIENRNRRRVELSHEGEALEPLLVRHRLDVSRRELQGELEIPVRESGRSMVDAKQAAVGRQSHAPFPLLGILPLPRQMTEASPGQIHQRRATPDAAVGDARAVRALGVLDVLLHTGAGL